MQASVVDHETLDGLPTRRRTQSQKTRVSEAPMFEGDPGDDSGAGHNWSTPELQVSNVRTEELVMHVLKSTVVSQILQIRELES